MFQYVHRVQRNPANAMSMSIIWQKSASVMYMGIPPFGGREQSYGYSPKEFRSRFMEDDPPLAGGLTAYRFLADSHVVSHARPS